MATRDGYYFIDITWKSGFKHTVPCRGYNLKSELAFNQSIFWIDTFNYYEVTKEQYEEKLWGSGYPADTEKTTSTSTTRSRQKTGASEKKDGAKPSRTKRSATPATKSTKKKAQSATPTKKRSSGSTTTRKTKDGTIPKPKRATKARPIAEESKEASTKVTRAKRRPAQDGKQDGKLSPAPNKRKPKPAP